MRIVVLLTILAIGNVPAVLACGEVVCSQSAATPWDLPACSEYDFNSALIESADYGDRSAIELLRRRYAETFTYAERYRIASVLLGRVRDDSAIWNELLPHAENAVNFAGQKEKLDAYCVEHGYGSAKYAEMSSSALIAVMLDRRARPLLLRALKSDDRDISTTGVLGLAIQHVETALPEIEAAVQRFPSNAQDLAFFKSDAADRVAEKVLSGAELEEYRRARMEI